MRPRVREEGGFLMLELLMAVVVLSIAIMAIMAGYDSAFMSLHHSARTTSASNIADNQMELYNALSYSSIGLDTTTLSSVKASNSTYTTDESTLTNQATATDHTFSCGTASQCLPVQTITGDDHRSYTVETFIRDVPSLSYSGRSEREVTIIVRDPNSAGSPIISQLSAAFDAGP